MGRAPRSGSRSAPGAWPARAVSALALALALTSQLSFLVHMAAVKHETCAEHGELVESHGSPHAGATFGNDRASADRASDPTSADPRAGEDLHDHCPLGTTPSLCEAPAFVAPVVTVAGALDDVAAPVARIAPVSVLRAAPKTSPPLVV